MRLLRTASCSTYHNRSGNLPVQPIKPSASVSVKNNKCSWPPFANPLPTVPLIAQLNTSSTTIHTALAAISTALTTLLAHKTEAEGRQTALEAAPAAAAALARLGRGLAIVHLVLRRIVALGRWARVRLSAVSPLARLFVAGREAVHQLAVLTYGLRILRVRGGVTRAAITLPLLLVILLGRHCQAILSQGWTMVRWLVADGRIWDRMELGCQGSRPLGELSLFVGRADRKSGHMGSAQLRTPNDQPRRASEHAWCGRPWHVVAVSSSLFASILIPTFNPFSEYHHSCFETAHMG